MVIVLVPIAIAHSWVEQLSIIASNSSYIGEYGYPRGFVDKGASGFDQNSNVWMIPPLQQQPPFFNSGNLLCHPSQRSTNQISEFPRLKVTPGSFFAMRYAENGHATIPGGGKGLLGKPERGGTVFVFGTMSPRSEEKLKDVLLWNTDGSGGDKRGILLTAQDFDDGRCYQLGNGAVSSTSRKQEFPNPLLGLPGTEHELFCETDIKVPENIEIGKTYTLYWVWQWPTLPGEDPIFPNGKDEYYTSCIDIDIVQGGGSAVTERVHSLIQQDPMPTAVDNFESRGALTTDQFAIYSLDGFGTSSAFQSTFTMS